MSIFWSLGWIDSKILEPHSSRNSKHTWLSKFPLTHYFRNASFSTCPRQLKACRFNFNREPVKELQYPKYNCSDVPECVSVTIKTRHRYDLVRRCIDSIGKFYPGIKVVVQDEVNPMDTSEFSAWLKYLKMNPLIIYNQSQPGVGLGRRQALFMAATKYVLIADDDFVFSNKTNISKLLDVIQYSDAHIVGGDTTDKEPFHGVIRSVWEPRDRIIQSTLPKVELLGRVFHDIIPSYENCYAAEFTKNFFLADREAILKAGSWDPTRPFFEHEDFFLQMRKERMKVIFCSDVVVEHVRTNVFLSILRKKHKDVMFKRLRKKWHVSAINWCKRNFTNCSL